MADLRRKIIVALDHSDARSAICLIEELGDQIEHYKLGTVLLASRGPEVLRVLQRRSKKILLDVKLHDTPKVVYDTLRVFADMGAHYATIHSLGGRKMCETASLACRGSHMKLIAVTLLTSASSGDFSWQESVIPSLVTMAVETRLAGIVCSALDLLLVRKQTPPGFLALAAGIRLETERVYEDDQQRVASPQRAFEWGADFIIVGRPITQAREPLMALNRLLAP